jgi:hypothetical protein
MYKRFFSVLYALNIIFQAIFTLLIPPSLLFLVTWLAVDKLGAPSWIYAITVTVGVIAGLISMIKFVLSAASNLERLEKSGENKSASGKKNDEK